MTVHYVLDWVDEGVALELMNAVTEWKQERPNSTIPATTDNAQKIVNAIHEADGFGPPHWMFCTHPEPCSQEGSLSQGSVQPPGEGHKNTTATIHDMLERCGAATGQLLCCIGVGGEEVGQRPTVNQAD